MTFYESMIANQGRQTLAVRMFVETSGECSAIIYFNWEARCV